jgi:hypothetical protein
LIKIIKIKEYINERPARFLVVTSVRIKRNKRGTMKGSFKNSEGFKDLVEHSLVHKTCKG